MECDWYVRFEMTVEVLYSVLTYLQEIEAWIGSMGWEGTRDNADVSALPSSVYLLRFAYDASGSLFQNRAFSMI